MDKENEYREFLISRKIDDDTISFSIRVIDDYLKRNPDKPQDPEKVKQYCRENVSGKADAFKQILSLIWFFAFTKTDEPVIYLITLLGTIGVLESQKDRMIQLNGEDMADSIFMDISFPPLGMPYEEYPAVIKQYLEKMQNCLNEEQSQRVLAGNHHRIPEEHFKDEFKTLQECGDFDLYLKQKHQKLIEQMQFYYDNDKLWYEQRITPEVIEMVKNNREIQTGIRVGKQLFITKIPYNPSEYLRESDPLQKRFLACHCPFVRSSILDDQIRIPSLWCYCTGGFEKLAFDVMFGKTLSVKVLESVLTGDHRCRFVIDLPDEALAFCHD